MPKLTHFDDNGNPNMVDVSQKETTVRIAEASGYVYMEKATLNTILNKEISKGDVFQIAKISGIMASKQTSSIIPLCHPIIIDKVTLEILPDFFQLVAKGLPLVYIFDETRNILLNGEINYENLKQAYFLNIIYLICGISLFYYSFLRARIKGTLINMGE